MKRVLHVYCNRYHLSVLGRKTPPRRGLEQVSLANVFAVIEKILQWIQLLPQAKIPVHSANRLFRLFFGTLLFRASPFGSFLLQLAGMTQPPIETVYLPFRVYDALLTREKGMAG
jgi:hypothetical protein